MMTMKVFFYVSKITLGRVQWWEKMDKFHASGEKEKIVNF